MPTWTDISASDPPDTEALSQGASRIRDIAEAAKETWGNEHYQDGIHKFPTSEPATPHIGQIWYDFTNRRAMIYRASGWNVVPTVGPFFAERTTDYNMTASYANVLQVSVNIPLNGRAVIFVHGVAGTTADALVLSRILRGAELIGGTYAEQTYGPIPPSTIHPFMYFKYDNAVTAGIHTYNIQFQGASLSTIILNGVRALVLVV